MLNNNVNISEEKNAPQDPVSIFNGSSLTLTQSVVTLFIDGHSTSCCSMLLPKYLDFGHAKLCIEEYDGFQVIRKIFDYKTKPPVELTHHNIGQYKNYIWLHSGTVQNHYEKILKKNKHSWDISYKQGDLLIALFNLEQGSQNRKKQPSQYYDILLENCVFLLLDKLTAVEIPLSITELDRKFHIGLWRYHAILSLTTNAILLTLLPLLHAVFLQLSLDRKTYHFKNPFGYYPVSVRTDSIVPPVLLIYLITSSIQFIGLTPSRAWRYAWELLRNSIIATSLAAIYAIQTPFNGFCFHTIHTDDAIQYVRQYLNISLTKSDVKSLYGQGTPTPLPMWNLLQQTVPQLEEFLWEKETFRCLPRPLLNNGYDFIKYLCKEGAIPITGLTVAMLLYFAAKYCGSSRGLPIVDDLLTSQERTLEMHRIWQRLAIPMTGLIVSILTNPLVDMPITSFGIYCAGYPLLEVILLIVRTIKSYDGILCMRV